MSTFWNRLQEKLSKAQPLPPGIHHYQSPADAARPYRIHLRLNKDGSGILILNAATVLHLNPTAAEYAYHFIKGTPPEDAAKAVASRYRVRKTDALRDYRLFIERLDTLIHTPDLDPVSFLGFERVTPHETALSAPLRLDCALTYRLPEGVDAADAPTKRVDRELTTEEWKIVLHKAWAFGIPHVVFTGGEPTLREDLLELVDFAESIGMVSGLLSGGEKLADESYVDALLQTGLDHLLFLLQGSASWDALKVILPKDLFTAVHITIFPDTMKTLDADIRRLAEMGANALSFTAAPGMEESLADARELASSAGLPLVWDLPVPYSAQNPVAFETAEENAPSGAGKAWLYIEPDGDVLPSQGMPDTILGNILRDDWKSIWQGNA
jgi:organic radical activating enzyme